jgi:FMN hydrolase / 5-amino-6-(5-phospho-D-ribitylamino)uracil phosphatase
VIEAVIFDWGGTLTPWVDFDHLAGWRAYAAVAHPDDPAAADAAARALAAAELARWAHAKQTHRAFTLAQVLADAGLPSHDAALAAYQEFWAAGATRTDPEAVPMLTELKRRGLALGVLSSTGWPAEWHESWLRRDGVLELLDGCVWSSDLDWTKPHAEAFGAAMAAVAVSDPGRCVFVGDRLYDDIHGARSAGMRTVLVPHSDIPAHQRVDVDVRPDAVIQRLSDLPGLLADW